MVQTPVAEQILRQQKELVEKHIKELDAALKKEIRSDPTFKEKVRLAETVPSVGPLIAAGMLVLSKGFTEHLNHKRLASYLGICPHGAYHWNIGTAQSPFSAVGTGVDARLAP